MQIGEPVQSDPWDSFFYAQISEPYRIMEPIIYAASSKASFNPSDSAAGCSTTPTASYLRV